MDKTELDIINELIAKTEALKADNERLKAEEDRLHKSIIEIACVGSEEKKYRSVPEMRVAMLYKEKEELKAENERLKENEGDCAIDCQPNGEEI
jgi:uncharacterized small protein (DUF1192 family)